jgi:hypothetical protein
MQDHVMYCDGPNDCTGVCCKSEQYTAVGYACSNGSQCPADDLSGSYPLIYTLVCDPLQQGGCPSGKHCEPAGELNRPHLCVKD